MSEQRTCQNCKADFVIEPEDFGFYRKIDVPAPTFCPTCRMQRRFAWRNERTLYRNTCAATGKAIISCSSPDSGMTVYDRDYWWSDDWDPFASGREYDFGQPFFTQFADLLKRAPMPAVFNSRTVNCSYCNYVGEMKDAYLVTASWEGENLAYASREGNCRDSMDLFGARFSELCYECINAIKCYRTFFSQNCENCSGCTMCFECKGCTDCFGCTNLRNKSHCFWNEQLDPEEYKRRVAALDISTASGLNSAWQKFAELKRGAIRKFASMINCQNVTGDYMVNSADCKYCFDLSADNKNCKWIQNGGWQLSDSYDGYGVGAQAELLYESFDNGVQGSLQCFAGTVYGGTNVFYALNCHGSSNLFGCIGLRNKEYCILNKQYTKEEFVDLRARIVAQMSAVPYTDKKGRVYGFGEFFPIELSPYAYNATVAQDHLLLTKEECEAEGYLWKDPEKPPHVPTIAAKDIPDSIQSIPEDFTKEIISCENCSRVFRIIPKELTFLKQFNLPIPRNCPECRHLARLALRNPMNLWHRKCMKPGCPNEFETSYAPDRSEIVYCEQCYNGEVV